MIWYRWETLIYENLWSYVWTLQLLFEKRADLIEKESQQDAIDRSFANINTKKIDHIIFIVRLEKQIAITLINSDASINAIEKIYAESQEIQLQFIDNSYLLYNHEDEKNQIEEVIKITKLLKMQLEKHIEII